MEAVIKDIREKYSREVRAVSLYPDNKYPKEVVRSWIRKYQTEGDSDAWEKAVYSCLSLVMRWASFYAYVSDSYEYWLDLVQEGNYELVRSLQKFNLSYGWAFTTFATPRIRRAMYVYLLKQDPIVRPVWKHTEIRRLKKELEARMRASGESDDGLEEELIREAEKQIAAFDAMSRVQRRKEVLGERGVYGTDFEPLLSDARASELIFERLFIPEAVDLILGFVSRRFSPRDAHIFSLRTGLNAEKILTLEQIGKIYGITKQAVQLREKKMLTDPSFRSFLKKLFYPSADSVGTRLTRPFPG